jgi:hypothetical protein
MTEPPLSQSIGRRMGEGGVAATTIRNALAETQPLLR